MRMVPGRCRSGHRGDGRPRRILPGPPTLVPALAPVLVLGPVAPPTLAPALALVLVLGPVPAPAPCLAASPQLPATADARPAGPDSVPPREAVPEPAEGSGRRVVLLDDLGPGWREHWDSKDLSWGGRNRYRPRNLDGDRVLEIRSEDDAGGLYRAFEHEPVPPGRLTWRWQIVEPIPADGDERTGERDDFAARLLVVFETHFLPWKHNALCYVWAAREPVGAVFPSPRSDDVGTFVLRSGKEETGRWATEERDVIADYRTYFDREPERISAVAVMVDTDDTGTQATAWFDDVAYEFRREPTGNR